jgi:hypothetical protein
MGQWHMDQVEAAPAVDAGAIAQVAAELETIDRPPSEQLSELLGEAAVSDDPATALDAMLVAEPEVPAQTEVPELTSDAFAELSPDVANIWTSVYGEKAADRVRDAGRALGVLAADEPTLEFVDKLADLDLGIRVEAGLWDALAQAGKRLSFNGVVGSPIAPSKIDTFEQAPTRVALEEAIADGLLPKDALARWTNGTLGNAPSLIMNARRGAAHLMRTMPELARAGVDLGLHRNPDVWRCLAELGQQVGRGGPSKRTDRTMTADNKADAIRAKLRELQSDPRYWRDRDPAIVAQVERGWAAVAPGIHQSGDSVSQAQSPIARGEGR